LPTGGERFRIAGVVRDLERLYRAVHRRDVGERLVVDGDPSGGVLGLQRPAPRGGQDADLPGSQLGDEEELLRQRVRTTADERTVERREVLRDVRAAGRSTL